MTQGDHPAKMSVAEWVRKEIASFSMLAAYLFVCFAALAYFKGAILEAHGVSFAPWGFAAIKAIIIAKFMLIARRLEPHSENDDRPLIIPTLYKSLGMLVLLIVLMLIEEVIVGWVHGNSIQRSLADIGGGTLHQRIATIAVLLLILMPFFAFRALGDRVGHRKLAHMFFHRSSLDGGHQ